MLTQGCHRLAFILFSLTKPPDMNTVQRNNMTLSYEVYGNGPITLLFIHGSFIDQTYWAGQVAHFKNRYTVITIDLAGHGQSGTSREQWTIGSMADDVVYFVKELMLKNVILIAHSLGADIALIVATRCPAPFIGFIALDIFKNAATPLPPQFRSQVAGILENAKKDFGATSEQYAQMALLTPDTPQWIADKIRHAYSHAHVPMGLATLPEFFEMDKVEKKLLPLLEWPLHLINVNYMPTNEEALKAHTGKGYTFTEMEGTSHYPMIEIPDELNKKLDSVINGILKNE